MKHLIKGLIFEVVLNGVVARAIKAVPFLGWPIIRPIFMAILNKVAEMVYEETDKNISFAVIDFQTEQEKKEYDKSVEVLKTAMEKNEGVDDARENYKKTLQRLITFKR